MNIPRLFLVSIIRNCVAFVPNGGYAFERVLCYISCNLPGFTSGRALVSHLNMN